MGSFYMTSHSGVTTDGEECILFFVIQNNADDEVYGLYKPISGPIPCTYADYGRYDLLDGGQEVFDDFAEFIKPQLKIFELGENEYHDIPSNPELFNWDYSHDLCHENRFFVLRGEKEIRVQRFVVHKSYYNSILNKYKSEKFTNDLLENFNADITKKKKEQFFFGMNQSLEMKCRFLDTESYTLPYYRQLFKNALELGELKDYQLKYISDAYSFKAFMRNAQFDFFPVNYGSQYNSQESLLFHAELLKKRVIQSCAEDYYNVLEHFDDLSEEDIKELSEKFSEMTIDELSSDKDFIILVEKKSSRKYYEN